MSYKQSPTRSPNRDDVVKAFSSEKMIWSSFKIVLLSAAFFGVSGAGVGATLGALAPDYYRAIFRMSADQSPIQLGVGLGLTQGLIAGVVVACVVVLTAAWYKSRVKNSVLASLEENEKQP